MRQVVELEDSSRWFTLSRTVRPQSSSFTGTGAEFVVGLGLDASLASPLSAARGLNLTTGEATPIGLGCRACTRPDCGQRSAPPAGRVLTFNERERGVTPFSFAGE